MHIRHKDRIAMTPPMGWNSWDCYMSAVTEEQLLGNAAYMVGHLKAYGWQYVVCDIQWYEPTAGTVPGLEYIPFTKLHMDAHGRLLPAENRFPSAAGGKGFAPIAEKIHQMGLRFGIHIMRGIPRQAVQERCVIAGTNVTADKAADYASICVWNSDMYGLLAGVDASQAYYDSLFQLYASWGVDYVKVDDISATGGVEKGHYASPHEIEMIRTAIDRCGRPMVLSLSPGAAPIERAWHLARNANMWRMTGDFWDNWPQLKHTFYHCELWQRHVAPGCWPDCDMLPLGHIGIAHGNGRQTRFTPDEQKTMMTLWSIFRSPLMLGGELRDTDPATLALLTNPEVIRLNTHSHSARQVMRDDAQAVWVSSDEDGGYYAALFNLSDEAREIRFNLAEIGLGRAAVRDVWAQQEQASAQDTFTIQIAPHGAQLYKIQAL